MRARKSHALHSERSLRSEESMPTPTPRHSDRSLRSEESLFDQRVLSCPAANANPVIPTGEPRPLRLAVEGSRQALYSTPIDVSDHHCRPSHHPRPTN
jgi:hypothetical protein